MVVEIKITPRKIERTILVIIILLLLGALYYYGYANCNCGAKTEEPLAEETPEEEPEEKEEEKDDSVSEESVEKPELPPPKKTSGDLSGKIAVSVPNLKYKVKKTDTQTYFIIEKFSVTVRNGKETTQTGVTVDFYKYESNAGADEIKGLKPLNKDPIPMGPVISGGSLTKSFPLSNPIRLWEENTQYVVKFVIKDGSKTLDTIYKYVTPEE